MLLQVEAKSDLNLCRKSRMFFERARIVTYTNVKVIVTCT